MATKLTKPISRETARIVGRRAVIVTLAPCGSHDEALVGLRLKGTRIQYVVRLSDIYRMAALWHGQREQRAKREARRNGVSWRIAKKQFMAQNTISRHADKTT